MEPQSNRQAEERCAILITWPVTTTERLTVSKQFISIDFIATEIFKSRFPQICMHLLKHP